MDIWGPYKYLKELIMTSTTLTVTSDSFDEEVLNSDIPVLVDFWAEWCGPCKMIAPVLEDVATEYKDRLKVCKLDIDKNEDISKKYNVRGIPYLMIFRNGKLEASKVGALSKSMLYNFIETNT